MGPQHSSVGPSGRRSRFAAGSHRSPVLTIDGTENDGAARTPTSRRLVLAGGLDAREIGNLTEYCGRLHGTGVRTLELDLSAVTTCDRHGLEGLVALTERGDGLSVVVTGARWRHFIGMLGQADVLDVRRLHAAARVLVVTR